MTGETLGRSSGAWRRRIAWATLGTIVVGLSVGLSAVPVSAQRVTSAAARVVIASLNTPGFTASTLTMSFSVIGNGAFEPPLYTVVPGCPTPIIVTDQGVNSYSVTINWGRPCVVSPASVTVTVYSTAVNTSASFRTGAWENVQRVPLRCADVRQIPPDAGGLCDPVVLVFAGPAVPTPAVPWLGGGGTFNFATSTCEDVFNLGGCSISASGTYTSVACGTGQAIGNLAVNSADSYTGTFSIVFVAAVGTLTAQLTDAYGNSSTVAGLVQLSTLGPPGLPPDGPCAGSLTITGVAVKVIVT